MNPVNVEILLATFNGEQYLPDQLESILQQTYQDFRILISDDGSTDSTLEIIKKYRDQYTSKIQFIKNISETPGPANNFSKLLSLSSAPYLLFSDQDDVWLTDKIEIQVNTIKKLEKKYTQKTPILVHSDLIVVDAELNELNKSFWKYIGINPNRDSLGNLLVQNIVTGCASIFNRSLAELSAPIPEQAMMHDWWLGLIAGSMGILQKMEKPTVFYRQHGANTLGAQPFSWSLPYFIKKANKLFLSPEKFILEEYLSQAKEFYRQHNSALSSRHSEILSNFINIRSMGSINRRRTLIRYGLTRNKLVQNIGLFLRI